MKNIFLYKKINQLYFYHVRIEPHIRFIFFFIQKKVRTCKSLLDTIYSRKSIIWTAYITYNQNLHFNKHHPSLFSHPLTHHRTNKRNIVRRLDANTAYRHCYITIVGWKCNDTTFYVHQITHNRAFHVSFTWNNCLLFQLRLLWARRAGHLSNVCRRRPLKSLLKTFCEK